jgi:hypothetical protein
MDANKRLTAPEILALRSVRVERVDLPDAGGHLFVRKLQTAEMDAWNLSNMEFGGRGGRKMTPRLEGSTARFVALVACDEAGARLFHDQQAAELGRVHADVLERIADAGRKFNGMDRDEEDRLGNSSPTRNGASATG